MTNVLQADAISFVADDDEQSFQRRIEQMWARVNDLFASQNYATPVYDPIFSDKVQVASMVSYFDKQQGKRGFQSDSGFLSKPALIDAMATHFTEYFQNNDTTGRHKLNVIFKALRKEEVRNSIARIAYNTDGLPVDPLLDKIGTTTPSISSMTSSIALGFHERTAPVINNITRAIRDLKEQGPSKDQLEILKYGNVVPTITNLAGSPEVVKTPPAPENAPSGLAASVSTIAMGFNNFIKPKITNFKQAVRDFSFKDFAQEKANDVVNAGNAFKQSYDNDKVGTLKSVAYGAGTGIALKMAFNTAATATGVGLVATVGYGLTKTFKEEYDKSKQSGNGFWQALKDAGNTKVDMALLKRSAKHSAFFGVGFGLGLGASDLIPDTVDTAPVQQNIEPIEDIKEIVPPKAIPAADPIFPEEIISQEDEPQFVEAAPEPVVELTAVQQRLVGLEGMTPEVLERLKDASPQDVKDMAVTQLWTEGGNQSLGAHLMEEASKMGNKQAINDVIALRDMGILPKLEDLDTRLARIEVPEEIGARLASENVKISMQAKNDMAIGMLNEKFGLEKNFPLGVDTLDDLASHGHAKSIRDLDTLIEYGMVSKDDLSTQAQMGIVLNDGALAACSRSLDTCSFSERAINDAVAQSSDSKITNASLKDAISQGFNMLQTGDNDIVPFNKAHTTGLVASIK